MNDGFLDVVFVTKRDRRKLRKHISDRLNGKKDPWHAHGSPWPAFAN
jgi:hypothetical protein